MTKSPVHQIILGTAVEQYIYIQQIFSGRSWGHLEKLKNTYSFKFSTYQWTKKEDMLYGSIKIACGLITTGSGEKEIVSMGNDIVTRGVEIYNIATDTWREGKLSFLGPG